MRTFCKLLGLVLGGVILILACGILSVALYFDPNDYKTELAGLVKNSINRELHIVGDIALSWFPLVGVTIGRVKLDNAPGFEGAPFAEIDSIALRARLLPLLWGKVDIAQLVLNGVQLRLARDEHGAPNWTDLTPAGSGQGGLRTGVPIDVDIHRLRVENLQIVYEDQLTERRLQTAAFSLSSDTLQGAQPLEVRAQFVAAHPQGNITGGFNFSGRMITDVRAQQLSLRNAELVFQLVGPNLPPPASQGSVRFAAQADLATQRVSIEEVVVHLAGLRVTGHFEAETVLSDPRIRGKFLVHEGKLRELLSLWANAQQQPPIDGTLTLSAAISADLTAQHYSLHAAQVRFAVMGLTLPPAGIRGELTFTVDADMAAQVATVRELLLTGLGLTIEGGGKIKRVANDLRYEGKLIVQEFRLRPLLTALGISPPATRAASVLSEAALTLPLTGDTAQLTLQPLRGHFDDTHLEGRINVRNFAEPAIRFELTLDTLNADRYRPPATDPTARSQADAAKPGLPKEYFPDLDLVGTFRIGTLTLNGQQTKDVVIKVNWDP